MFHFDIGTQCAAGAVLCFAFGVALFLAAKRLPRVMGAFHLAMGFLLACTGICMFLLRGRMPLTLSVLLANTCMWISYLLFYQGVASALKMRARLLFPATVAVVALCLVGYEAAAEKHFAVRIFIVSMTNCLIQLNFFVDLVRHRPRMFIVKLIAFYVGFFICSNLTRAVAAVTIGSSPDVFQFDPLRAFYVLTGVMGACCMGIFSMALINHQVTEGIQRDARRDPLTGALNRLGIEEFLLAELSRSGRTASPFSIALLDIDQFKTFNDIGGHAAGDEVLRRLVAALVPLLRPYDACGRLGGDEFLVVLSGVSHNEALAICDRMLREIAFLSPPSTLMPSPTVSIGLAVVECTDSSAELLARADRALYLAKKEGRNCVRTGLSQRGPTAAAPVARHAA